MNEPTNETKPTETTPFSVLHLTILLHAYAYPEPFPEQYQASKRYADELVLWGLIERQGNKLATTDRGIAHIKNILSTPLPVQVWVDPRTVK